MKCISENKIHKISLDIYNNILELRKLSHKGIDIKIERQTLLDLSESLKKLADEKK